MPLAAAKSATRLDYEEHASHTHSHFAILTTQDDKGRLPTSIIGYCISPNCPHPPPPTPTSAGYLFGGGSGGEWGEGGGVITFVWLDCDLRSQEINVL